MKDFLKKLGIISGGAGRVCQEFDPGAPEQSKVAGKAVAGGQKIGLFGKENGGLRTEINANRGLLPGGETSGNAHRFGGPRARARITQDKKKEAAGHALRKGDKTVRGGDKAGEKGQTGINSASRNGKATPPGAVRAGEKFEAGGNELLETRIINPRHRVINAIKVNLQTPGQGAPGEGGGMAETGGGGGPGHKGHELFAAQDHCVQDNLRFALPATFMRYTAAKLDPIWPRLNQSNCSLT